MLNINFVPDDYIQSNESRRTNIMYLLLFVVVMLGLAGAFMTIKIRERAVAAKEQEINDRMVKAQVEIEKFEHLQQKSKAMMKTAVTTAGLQEPVPRSVMLAAITNNLPPGTSLLNLEVEQKEKKINQTSQRGTRFQEAANKPDTDQLMSPEQNLETHISIEGVAPSDLQVAAYIENLGCSALLDNVALVESKEEKKDEDKWRQFKLTAMLREDVHLTKQDISDIRSSGSKSTHKF